MATEFTAQNYNDVYMAYIASLAAAFTCALGAVQMELLRRRLGR